MEKSKEPSGKGKGRYLLTGMLLVTALVAAVLFLKEWQAAEKAKRPLPLQGGAYYPIPKTRGPENAPIRLVEYSDFECPACRAATVTLNEIFAAYPGKIQLTYHHYPLTSHKWSHYAHQAAECMHIQGKFWLYHDMLYDKQTEWAVSTTAPVEILAQYARDCGADMNLFSNCMADTAVARGIYAEKEEGSRKAVTATPTVFLGDQRFVGPTEMKERGHNAIRRILGLPPISGLVKKEEPKKEEQAAVKKP